MPCCDGWHIGSPAALANTLDAIRAGGGYHGVLSQYAWTLPYVTDEVGAVAENVRAIGAGAAHRDRMLVVDSYPVLGWEGHHLQPPDRVAAALLRGDGREGGVLAIVPAAEREAVRSMASGLGLEERLWDNGTRRLTA